MLNYMADESSNMWGKEILGAGGSVLYDPAIAAISEFLCVPQYMVGAFVDNVFSMIGFATGE